MNYRNYVWLAKMAKEEGITPKQMQIEIQKSMDTYFKFIDYLLKVMAIILLLIVVYLTTILSVHDSIKLISELVVIILVGWFLLNAGCKLIDRFVLDEQDAT